MKVIIIIIMRIVITFLKHHNDTTSEVFQVNRYQFELLFTTLLCFNEPLIKTV